MVFRQDEPVWATKVPRPFPKIGSSPTKPDSLFSKVVDNVVESEEFV